MGVRARGWFALSDSATPDNLAISSDTKFLHSANSSIHGDDVKGECSVVDIHLKHIPSNIWKASVYPHIFLGPASLKSAGVS